MAKFSQAQLDHARKHIEQYERLYKSTKDKELRRRYKRWIENWQAALQQMEEENAQEGKE